jgi:hypothetical protein
MLEPEEIDVGNNVGHTSKGKAEASMILTSEVMIFCLMILHM